MTKIPRTKAPPTAEPITIPLSFPLVLFPLSPGPLLVLVGELHSTDGVNNIGDDSGRCDDSNDWSADNDDDDDDNDTKYDVCVDDGDNEFNEGGGGADTTDDDEENDIDTVTNEDDDKTIGVGGASSVTKDKVILRKN